MAVAARWDSHKNEPYSRLKSGASPLLWDARQIARRQYPCTRVGGNMRKSKFGLGVLSKFGLLVLAMMLTAPPAKAQTAAINGRVLDAVSGSPINGAQVLIVGTTRGAAAGNDGRFRIAGVRAGTYQLRVARIGYKAVTQTVTLGGTDLTGI